MGHQQPVCRCPAPDRGGRERQDAAWRILCQKAQAEGLSAEALADYKKQYAEAENRIRELETEKESLRQTEKELANYGGQVNIYEPKASDSFGGRINTLYQQIDDPTLGNNHGWHGPDALDAEAARKLQNDKNNFAKEVDKIFNVGNAPRNRVQMLTQTPMVLQMLGNDLRSFRAAAEGGIWVSTHSFNQAFSAHPEMDASVFKQLPEALANPIAIFDPSPKSKDYQKNLANGDLIFMLAVKDNTGATVVLPVTLNAQEKGVTVNLVKSGFGKTYTDKNGVIHNNDLWFLNQIEKEKTARYVNRRLLSAWAGIPGPHTLPSEPYRNRHGHKVYNERDLVKNRLRNPTLYQGAGDLATGFDARGAYLRNAGDGQSLIAMFQGKADISTVIHEGAGHFFLENLREAAQLQNAPAWVRDGWQDVARAIGADVNPSVPVGTDAHELFARMATDAALYQTSSHLIFLATVRQYKKHMSSLPFPFL